MLMLHQILDTLYNFHVIKGALYVKYSKHNRFSKSSFFHFFGFREEG